MKATERLEVLQAIKRRRGLRVWALIGGIASGKSEVARMFSERLDCPLFDADAEAHRVLASASVARRLAGRFGEEILDRAGLIDRKALGRRVFADAEALAALEDVVHERVFEALADFLDGSASGDVVLDVTLLVETGMGELADVLVAVAAPLEMRIERARARGWDDGEIERRERHQAPPDQKERSADHVVDNSLSRQAAGARVDQIVEAVHRTAPGSRSTDGCCNSSGASIRSRDGNETTIGR